MRGLFGLRTTEERRADALEKAEEERLAELKRFAARNHEKLKAYLETLSQDNSTERQDVVRRFMVFAGWPNTDYSSIRQEFLSARSLLRSNGAANFVLHAVLSNLKSAGLPQRKLLRFDDLLRAIIIIELFDEERTPALVEFFICYCVEMEVHPVTGYRYANHAANLRPNPGLTPEEHRVFRRLMLRNVGGERSEEALSTAYAAHEAAEHG